jgi:SHS2 domain-containing protein
MDLGEQLTMHEVFEHTADLGLRIRAPDLPTLFVDAAHALFAAIVEDIDSIRPQQTIEIRLPLQETELLFFDWLRELLYQFDVHHLLFHRLQITIDENGLLGRAEGEPFDRSRHIPLHEVKAITYHGLRVEKEANAWLAEVIVDI